MRFSLRTLLLLPVAFWITLVVVVVYQFGSYGHPRFINTVVNVRSVHSQLAGYFERHPDLRISIPEINHGLATDHWPALGEARLYFGGIPRETRYDSWGKPLRAVFNARLPSGEIQRVGVYSLGEDGISASEGNDEDDINSWSEKPGYGYMLKYQSAERMSQIIRSLFFTPVTLGIMIALWALVKSMLRGSRNSPRSLPSK